MKKKCVTNHISLTPALMRLAAVLAEIASNEPTCTPTVGPVFAPDDSVEQKIKNPLGSQKK